MPSLLTVGYPFDEADAVRIFEHELCRFEIDSMFCLVRCILGVIPFETHLYLL